MRSFEEVHAEEIEIGERLEYINTQSGGIFSTTAISLQEKEWRAESPYYTLYRECTLKLLGVWEEIFTDHRGRFSFEEFMEHCFLLAAECCFLNEWDKMEQWAGRIDWTRWNVLTSTNPDVIGVYRELREAIQVRGGHKEGTS